MRGASVLFLFLLWCFPFPTPAFAQAAPDYNQLDPRPYDPKVDPDTDLFMGHWRESIPRETTCTPGRGERCSGSSTAFPTPR